MPTATDAPAQAVEPPPYSTIKPARRRAPSMRGVSYFPVSQQGKDVGAVVPMPERLLTWIADGRIKLGILPTTGGVEVSVVDGGLRYIARNDWDAKKEVAQAVAYLRGLRRTFANRQRCPADHEVYAHRQRVLFARMDTERAVLMGCGGYLHVTSAMEAA